MDPSEDGKGDVDMPSPWSRRRNAGLASSWKGGRGDLDPSRAGRRCVHGSLLKRKGGRGHVPLLKREERRGPVPLLEREERRGTHARLGVG